MAARSVTGEFIQRNQNDFNGASRTYERVAKEMGVGAATVQRAEKFAKGLDVIGESEPDLKQESEPPV